MARPTFGVVLPSHRLASEATRHLVRDLREAADAAGNGGADTLWVWDHMLRAPVYRDAWHDPLVSLGAVADFGLRLGTGVLVAPVRPPVQTAMAVATLQAMSGHPMRLGVGTGWNPTEFEAAGVARAHRGALTDEFIDVVESVFRGDPTYSGRFHEYTDLETGHVGGAPDIWIAGGSRAAGGGALGEKERLSMATMAPTVARRILRQGRWLLRPTAEMTDYQRDLGAIAAVGGPGTDVSGIRTGTIAVGHLVETDDPVRAREIQHPVLTALVSEKRPPEYVEARYLVGSLAEVRSRLEAWVGVGLEHVGLYLFGDVPEQVALVRKHFGDLFDLTT